MGLEKGIMRLSNDSVVVMEVLTVVCQQHCYAVMMWNSGILTVVGPYSSTTHYTILTILTEGINNDLVTQ